jgi:ATP-dependent Clp protease ATP-binding subunit ClpB
MITYQPLDAASLATIIDQQIVELERHIENRLLDRAFELSVEKSAREFILRKGTSDEYGARELKRTILRHITQPLAAMVANGRIAADALVRVEAEGDRLSLTVEDH